MQNQDLQVKIALATSTPNEHIESLVRKYQLEYYINTGNSGIAEDWNFALAVTDKRVVTIAHQDDVYKPDYVREILKNINKQDNTLIAFTNYGELRNGEYITDNRLLNMKRFMLIPLKNKKSTKDRLRETENIIFWISDMLSISHIYQRESSISCFLFGL